MREDMKRGRQGAFETQRSHPYGNPAVNATGMCGHRRCVTDVHAAEEDLASRAM